MVAKKTAVQQSASGRSTGPAAKDVSGKKSAQGAPAEGGTAAAKPVKNASKRTARASGASEAPEAPEAPEAATGKAKTAASKGSVSKTAASKTAASRTAVKKASAKKTTAKKAVATKTAAKKVVGKKAAVAEAVPEESAPAKDGTTSTKGGTTKRAGAKRAAKKSSSSAAKKAVASAAQGAAQAAKTTGATTVVAKKTPGTATAAKKPGAVPKARVSAVVEPGGLAVRPGEDPWTPEEVAEARAELQSEALRLSSEISSSEEALAGLMRDSGDGAGDDQADTGTKNITRESEMALNANAREMLEQTERALERLEAGTYGLCENCGNPIGKARMQAFPRATLCVECKQKQERRY